MKLRVAGFERESVVDGLGIRYVVFTQGCKHNCAGCHNPETHSFKDGTLIETSDIIDDFKKFKWHKGITLSGGDPFFQPLASKEIADAVHRLGKDVWCYTGFTIEDILNGKDKDRKSLLESVDVLVDGRFELNKRTLDLAFRGSANQRVINVKETLKNKSIVLLDV